jgi:hypothetical protein
MEEADFDKIKNLFETSLEKHLASVHEELSDFRDDVTHAFSDMGDRFDRLEDRVTAVESRLGGIDRRLDDELLRRNNLEDRVRAAIPDLPPRPQRI